MNPTTSYCISDNINTMNVEKRTRMIKNIEKRTELTNKIIEIYENATNGLTKTQEKKIIDNRIRRLKLLEKFYEDIRENSNERTVEICNDHINGILDQKNNYLYYLEGLRR